MVRGYSHCHLFGSVGCYDLLEFSMASYPSSRLPLRMDRSPDLSFTNKMSFEELVLAMRNAQKRYFRERSQEALQEAKRLEQLVDEWLQTRS